MTSDLVYAFDDLPLFADGDWHTGFLSGSALIEFDDDEHWKVGWIKLDVYAVGGKTKSVFIGTDEALYWLIGTALRKHDSEHIITRIHEALDEAQSDFNRRETMAEMRREARAG